MANLITDERTPGYTYATANRNPMKGPYVIYRDGTKIGMRSTLEDAVVAVLNTQIHFPRWVCGHVSFVIGGRFSLRGFDEA